MAKNGYWYQNRATRRRFLAATGAFGIGVSSLALFGCGRSSEPERPVSNLDSIPDNTTSSAKAGGTLKGHLAFDTNNFDPLASPSLLTHSLVAAYTYPRLLKFAAAVYPESAKGDVEGDLAETFELSPDRLQLTLRMRQGLRWEQRPPTASRFIDAQDVVFSWGKFARFSPFRGDLAYHAEQSPSSPIDTVTSPDPRTVVIKMKQLDSSIFGLLASERLFYVMPRESDGGFDPRIDVRGYGPWLLTENRPGIFRAWSKNPDYYVKNRPFIERIDQTNIADYNARLAQFKAGLLWTSAISQDDLLPTKRELPELLLRKADTFATTPSSLAFGYDGDSPWKDERLRQAVSLLLDRETLIDVRTNRATFAQAGLPLDVRYHTAIGAGWEGYWVDPLDEARFGPNGRYFKFDPAEARKLMVAAGYPDGLDTLLHYNGGSEYGPGYTRTAELLSGMLYQGDVRATPDPREFADWQPNYMTGYSTVANPGRSPKGYPGLIYRSVFGYPTPATQVNSTFHRAGAKFHGMTPDGKNAQLGDPEVNRMIEEFRREFDVKRQQSLALDFSRFMARKAYDIPMLPFAALNYSLIWPVVANYGVYRGWPAGSHVTETSLHHWIDFTKPPLAPRAN